MRTKVTSNDSPAISMVPSCQADSRINSSADWPVPTAADRTVTNRRTSTVHCRKRSSEISPQPPRLPASCSSLVSLWAARCRWPFRAVIARQFGSGWSGLKLPDSAVTKEALRQNSSHLATAFVGRQVVSGRKSVSRHESLPTPRGIATVDARCVQPWVLYAVHTRRCSLF